MAVSELRAQRVRRQDGTEERVLGEWLSIAHFHPSTLFTLNKIYTHQTSVFTPISHKSSTRMGQTCCLPQVVKSWNTDSFVGITEICSYHSVTRMALSRTHMSTEGQLSHFVLSSRHPASKYIHFFHQYPKFIPREFNINVKQPHNVKKKKWEKCQNISINISYDVISAAVDADLDWDWRL